MTIDPASLADENRAASAPENPFTAAHVKSILLARGWMTEPASQPQEDWCERAAALLGPRAADSSALAELLALVFEYDARKIVSGQDAPVVMSRYAARDAIRHLALLLLDDAPVTPERFQEIVTRLKEQLDIRGRELFHPLRLALAGRSGEGELDRVILLLEPAVQAGFAPPVKNARSRVLEFCAALD
jgi:glutamyl/glutaminyl-tRNA synthetase